MQIHIAEIARIKDGAQELIQQNTGKEAIISFLQDINKIYTGDPELIKKIQTELNIRQKTLTLKIDGKLGPDTLHALCVYVGIRPLTEAAMNQREAGVAATTQATAVEARALSRSIGTTPNPAAASSRRGAAAEAIPVMPAVSLTMVDPVVVVAAVVVPTEPTATTANKPTITPAAEGTTTSTIELKMPKATATEIDMVPIAVAVAPPTTTPPSTLVSALPSTPPPRRETAVESPTLQPPTSIKVNRDPSKTHYDFSTLNPSKWMMNLARTTEINTANFDFSTYLRDAMKFGDEEIALIVQAQKIGVKISVQWDSIHRSNDYKQGSNHVIVVQYPTYEYDSLFTDPELLGNTSTGDFFIRDRRESVGEYLKIKTARPSNAISASNKEALKEAISFSHQMDEFAKKFREKNQESVFQSLLYSPQSPSESDEEYSKRLEYHKSTDDRRREWESERIAQGQGYRDNLKGSYIPYPPSSSSNTSSDYAPVVRAEHPSSSNDGGTANQNDTNNTQTASFRGTSRTNGPTIVQQGGRNQVAAGISVSQTQ